ncbi:MAG TPA: hypothetical protein VHW92_01505 [Mycobacteriales bacterium]|jgi:hypothetical protein|nr:hypothetical protein [Mycobacteriales bacterium]
MSLSPVLAEQRAAEIRRAVESSRPTPEPAPAFGATRAAVGHTLVRFGEWLARPAGVPATR